MNRYRRTANLSTASLLLLALSPCAFAADAGSGAETKRPEMSPEARMVDDTDPLARGYFAPDPSYEDKPYDAEAQLAIYCSSEQPGGPRCDRHLNETAQPPLQLGRRLYDRGEYAPSPTWLGRKNPISAHFMVYGDLRTAVAYNDDGVAGANGKTHQATVATRLNLDLDLSLTATERIHAFVRPFDDGRSFTRYEIDGRVDDEFAEEFDLDFETLFFEGDLGAIAAGWRDESNNIDLPVAFGRVPIIAQNGIWIEDAFDGLAFGITAKNSASRDISNMDLTFFTGFNQVTTGAVTGGDANLFGVAGFVDTRRGYLEFGYGYVDAPDDLSYHNVTAAFSRRFGHSVSNSVRLIGNLGQDPSPGRQKTADGFLVLVESSLITSKPLTLIPYLNLFAGFDSPQALARTAGSGGVLRNTGINFETDGLTGFPTLDASGHDSFGGALGVEYLFDLNRQLVVEAAMVERMGDSALGSEYALGARFQEPLTNAWILRLDAMAGWREDRRDILGARIELRRKF